MMKMQVSKLKLKSELVDYSIRNGRNSCIQSYFFVISQMRCYNKTELIYKALECNSGDIMDLIPEEGETVGEHKEE